MSNYFNILAIDIYRAIYLELGMSQKLVVKNNKQQRKQQVVTAKVMTEEDILIRAKSVRMELEDKIPLEYTNLVDEAIKVTKQSSREFVSKFEQALHDAGIKGEEARYIIIADCAKIGWSYNTYRRYFSDRIKNKNKGKGPKSAALKRKEQRDKATTTIAEQQQQKKTTEGEELESEKEYSFEKPLISIIEVGQKLSRQFKEKIEFSEKHGGKGAIRLEVTTTRSKKTGEFKAEVTNISVVIPTDREKELRKEEQAIRL